MHSVAMAMVALRHSITAIHTNYVGNSVSFIVTMAMVVMGDTCVYHGHMQY